jgi:putative tryptophan/tyrosine transport system substrate-binding protein
MNRRKLLLLLSGALSAPGALWAQQKARPVVGYLTSGTPGPNSPGAVAFRQGLGETNYVEGQDLTIEYRWAEGHYDRLPALAADLVSRKVDVIAALTTPSALAAKEATSTIPIVFSVGDPIEAGLVAGLARPGGNLTGVSVLSVELMEAARTAVRAGSPGQGDRPAGEPELFDDRANHSRRAGSGAHEGGAAPYRES